MQVKLGALGAVGVVVAITLLLETEFCLGLSQSKLSTLSSTSQSSINVWDGVLSNDVQGRLHVAACKGGLGHKAFSREPLKQQQHPNIIETALDQILTELGDTSQYVEYWTRQEWRSIEAHADVDEFLAKEQDALGNFTSTHFRYPATGHVLYLRVGSQVQGPTCIFPGKKSGGDLLEESMGNAGDTVDVVTVPAVPGRLLRFDGTYLHAVPRPADLWLLKFVKGAPQYDPEEEWGRSVILFNTWHVRPPLLVPLDQAASDDDLSSLGDQSTVSPNQFDAWEEVYTLDASDPDTTCQVDSETTSDGGSSSVTQAKIWLLGNERRRAHPMRTLKLLSSNENTLRRALMAKSTVSHVALQIPK